jgi:hypothetical protein
MTNGSVVRGVAAVGIVLCTIFLSPVLVALLYGAGLHIPTFLQTVAIIWPQYVFFRPSLYSLAFWAVVALVFAFVVPVRSFPRLLAVAALCVSLTVIVLLFAAPVFGWKIPIEFP